MKVNNKAIKIAVSNQKGGVGKTTTVFKSRSSSCCQQSQSIAC